MEYPPSPSGFLSLSESQEDIRLFYVATPPPSDVLSIEDLNFSHDLLPSPTPISPQDDSANHQEGLQYFHNTDSTSPLVEERTLAPMQYYEELSYFHSGADVMGTGGGTHPTVTSLNQNFSVPVNWRLFSRIDEREHIPPKQPPSKIGLHPTKKLKKLYRQFFPSRPKATTYYFWDCKDHDWTRKLQPPANMLRYINKRAYKKAWRNLDDLFRDSTFSVEWGVLPKFLEAVGPRGREKIQSIALLGTSVDMAAPGKDTDPAMPSLKMLAEFKSLKKLSVHGILLDSSLPKDHFPHYYGPAPSLPSVNEIIQTSEVSALASLQGLEEFSFRVMPCDWNGYPYDAQFEASWRLQQELRQVLLRSEHAEDLNFF